MEQVVNLHYMLAKARTKAQPSVLWCYKKELEISSNKQKRLKQIKKMESKGNLDKEEINQIELFMSSKDIRYCYYKDTHRILGQTFGMCVLQDFESITPNVLCRTIETVEGSGLVVMLFNTMTSLKQLYTISMDVHARYRTEAHGFVEPRFNERFILSLASCKTCLAIDDELNILNITSHIKEIKEVQMPGATHSKGEERKTENLYLTKEQKELKDLKASLKDVKPIGNLVSICKTLDQARSVMQIVDTISEKSLKTTISLTAGRGRGKSAALGISIASSIVYGFSNIFVTAPTPENLKSVFEFLFKGLDVLGYKEHQDYEILQSTNPEFNNAVVRVNIYRDHRQTIQYIRPQDHAKLSQAELLVIDEAAAIPITIVKQLLGPYLVFMSSTVNGYEGTGRSLSLKLINQLRDQNRLRYTSNNHQQQQQQQQYSGRLLKEVQLDEPIRYSPNDPIEKWLNDLLCLDATQDIDPLSQGCPHPNSCDLYFVNRDTLFSYHSSSEKFLKKLMSIFVSSHYKNSPNDLLLLSDAPAHQVFVLLGPITAANGGLPDILCAIQVCFEGDISKQTIVDNLKRGIRPSGDLIPWTVSEQYQDDSFASLNGLRIVRIATHPNAQGKGYGTRALELLIKYYDGQLTDFDNIQTDEIADLQKKKPTQEQTPASGSLKDEKVKPKKHLKPILQKLSERKPLPIHYVGTSFGVTKELYNFWRKNQFIPLYMRLTPNELTGEHTCIMIRPLQNQEQIISLPESIKNYIDSDSKESWAGAYTADFRKRMLNLLGFEFRDMSCSLALSIVNPRINANQNADESQPDTAAISQISKEALEKYISLFDLKRLESYSKNLVDFHLIMDLTPTLAKMYFAKELLPKGVVSLSYTQSAILLGMGLQHKTVDTLLVDLNLQANQLLPLFNKGIRKFTRVFREVYEREIAKQMEIEEKNKPILPTKGMKQSLQEDLNEGENKMTQKMKDEKAAFIKQFSKHQIKQTDEDFEKAVGSKKQINVISVEKRKRDSDDDVEDLEQKTKSEKKKNKRPKN